MYSDLSDQGLSTRVDLPDQCVYFWMVSDLSDTVNAGVAAVEMYIALRGTAIFDCSNSAFFAWHRDVCLFMHDKIP